MNEIKYKYWFFYIKPEYLHLVCTEDKDSLLYAYTDNKEYSKIFTFQRDMNKFFVVKREIDKDEVNYLAKYFMREFLIKKPVKTKSNGIGSKIIDYDLIITQTEDNIIQSIANRVLMVDLWKQSWINPYIFKDKYIQLLDNIGFKRKYDIINNNITKNENYIYPDLLSTFIREFGFLLSLKKGE